MYTYMYIIMFPDTLQNLLVVPIMFYSNRLLDRLGTPPTAVTFALEKAIFHSIRTAQLDDRIHDLFGLLWQHDLVFCPLKHL